jgi:hypothetical protein
MLAPAAVPVAAHAAVTDCGSNITNKVAEGAGGASGNPGNINCNGTGVENESIKTLAQKIVNIFSIIVGAVSILMIIYGGFRYITSGGASEKVGGAKNTLIYAIIGLVIVALAQVIVHFVLFQANSIGTA